MRTMKSGVTCRASTLDMFTDIGIRVDFLNNDPCLRVVREAGIF